MPAGRDDRRAQLRHRSVWMDQRRSSAFEERAFMSTAQISQSRRRAATKTDQLDARRRGSQRDLVIAALLRCPDPREAERGSKPIA
jgi:hypothetical protein